MGQAQAQPEEHGNLIGPSGTPPPFARSRPRVDRDLEGLSTARWRTLIESTCAEWGGDPVRVEAHMLLESGGADLDPNGAGAVGLMQIVPEVWPELCTAVCKAHGLVDAAGSYRAPEVNIEIGVRELQWWIEQECDGDADGGSCAYFSGHCVPNGASDDFGTSDAQYVEVVRQNMARVRADQAGETSSAFGVGELIEVFDGPLRRRDGPGLAAAVLDEAPTGARLRVVSGPAATDGFAWYEVSSADDEGEGKGWVAGEFCRRV